MNKDIWEALNIEPLLLMVERQQLRWYGHVLRMPPERTARKVLLTSPDERRPIGRPRATWIKQINGLCRRAGIEPSETQTLAEDRTEWKRLTTE